MKTFKMNLMVAAAATFLSIGMTACRTPEEHGEHPTGEHPAADAEHPEHPDAGEHEHPEGKEHPKAEHPEHPRGN